MPAVATRAGLASWSGSYAPVIGAPADWPARELSPARRVPGARRGARMEHTNAPARRTGASRVHARGRATGRAPARGSGEAVGHLHAIDRAYARVAPGVAGEVPPGASAAEPAVVDAVSGRQAAAAGVTHDGAGLEPARDGNLARHAQVGGDGRLQFECGHGFVLSWAVARRTATRPAGLPPGTASREDERTCSPALRSVTPGARFRFDSVALRCAARWELPASGRAAAVTPSGSAAGRRVCLPPGL